MYSLGNVLKKNPIQISLAVNAVLNSLVIAEVIELSNRAIAAGNVAMVAVLSLFVVSNTTNTAKLEELSDQIR